MLQQVQSKGNVHPRKGGEQDVDLKITAAKTADWGADEYLRKRYTAKGKAARHYG